MTPPRPGVCNQHPIGWTTVALGDIVDSIEAGVSVNSENRPAGVGEIGVLKSSCAAGGRFLPDEHKTVVHADVSRVRVSPRRGSTILSRMNTPTLVGESGYVSKDYPDLFLPDRLWQIRPAPEADGRWLSMVLSSPLFRRMIGRAATGTSGSMKNLSQDALLQLEVALPPPSEQRGIVAVLSAWDLAIELMDNLIALKRRVLLGLLQSLVEHADFPLRELGDFATPVKARINPAEANDAQDSVELDAIEGGTGRVLERTTLTTASGPRTRFRAGDVLFGKLRPYLNKFTLADDDGVCSTEIWALRPDQSLCTSDWLFALVQTQAFQAEANRPTGSRMPRAEWSVVAQAPLPLPEIEEQRRCVRPFIDCHRQVQILISRGELLRAQKHGLMQHLLTGNWRPLADGSRSAT